MVNVILALRKTNIKTSTNLTHLSMLYFCIMLYFLKKLYSQLIKNDATTKKAALDTHVS